MIYHENVQKNGAGFDLDGSIYVSNAPMNKISRAMTDAAMAHYTGGSPDEIQWVDLWLRYEEHGQCIAFQIGSNCGTSSHPHIDDTLMQTCYEQLTRAGFAVTIAAHDKDRYPGCT